MASTADCKEFLDTYTQEHSLGKKWKRIRKYKEGEWVLRDFENENQDKVTIMENTEEKLFIKSFERNMLSPIKGNNQNNSISTIQSAQLDTTLLSNLDEQKLIEELVKVFVANEKYCEEKLSWKRIFNKQKIPESNPFTVENVMKAFSNMSRKEIQDSLEYFLYYYIYTDFIRASGNFLYDIQPEQVGVDYSYENCYCELKVKDKIAFLSLNIGGDWEVPIFAYVHWDENKQRLVGVFPKGNENLYNQATNTAYGSEIYHSSKFEKEFEELDENYDERKEEVEEKAFIHLKNRMK